MTDKLPGRLGNPEETLVSDPRTDPRITERWLCWVSWHMLPTDTNASYEEALITVLLLKAAALSHPMDCAMPDFPSVVSSEPDQGGRRQRHYSVHPSARRSRPTALPGAHSWRWYGTNDRRGSRFCSLAQPWRPWA